MRRQVIRKRLNQLDGYLAILCKLRRYSVEEFVEEPERYGSAECFLQLAIEVVNDVGSHIVAELRLGFIESYSDIPKLLHKGHHTDAELRDRWLRMIGFRNILVHDYLDVDRRLVYRLLQEDLGDFQALRRALGAFL